MPFNEPRDVQELIQAMADGWKPEFFLFWGHKSTPGIVDNQCLSQWYDSPFSVDGVRYRTAEHFMMAEKARLFGDMRMIDRIVDAPTPKEAKKFGREVTGFDQHIWERERSAIVVTGNIAKFGEHEDLKAFLLSTGTAVLVEASPRDRIWGIGMSASNPKALSPEGWRGRNLLGFALMVVRARLLN